MGVIMKIKLISVLLVIILLVVNIGSARSLDYAKPKMPNRLIKPTYLNKNDFENDTFELVQIFGPINSQYTDIELIDGPSSKIDRIENMLNGLITRFILPFAFIYAENITFEIKFKKEPLYDNSRFSYITFWGDFVNNSMENVTFVFNTKHTVSVTNLTGFFLVTKARPLRFTPSYFFIVGIYDKLLVTE
jgi:hypothetical protein